MSIDYTVYVGPYVKCMNPLVDIEEGYNACTNPVCKLYKRELLGVGSVKGFCQGCGQPIGTLIRKKQKSKINPWEVRESINEQLANVCAESAEWVELILADEAKFDIWIPNVDRGNGEQFDPKSEYKYFDMTDHDIVGDIDAFKTNFVKEIQTLVEAYGDANVRIRWGVFNWAQ